MPSLMDRSADPPIAPGEWRAEREPRSRVGRSGHEFRGVAAARRQREVEVERPGARGVRLEQRVGELEL